MMKKSNQHIRLLAIALLLFFGCKKPELPLDVSSLRTDEVLTDYDQLMGSSAHGWKVFLYPDIKKRPSNTGGYSFFMKFDPVTKRVKMVSDFDAKTSSVIGESTYTYKFTSLSTLSFDGYSYVSIPADPDPAISKAEETGPGNYVDVEYSMLGSSPLKDTIYLRGNLHHCAGYMIKASEKEEAYFMQSSGYDKTISAFHAALLNKTGLHITLPSGAMVVAIFDQEKRKVALAQEISADSIRVLRSGFTYSGEGRVSLNVPYDAEGLLVREIVLTESGLAAQAGATTLPITNLGKPQISAYKMIASGAYSAIRTYYDASKRATWPHNAEINTFISKAKDLNILFLEGFGGIRFFDFEWSFNVPSKRLKFTVPFEIFDAEEAAKNNVSSFSSAEEKKPYWLKGTAPYGYRYQVNSNDELQCYYEGPLFVYADQLAVLNTAFRKSITESPIKVEYSQAPNNLLICLTDLSTGEVIIEGLPF